MPGRAYPEGSLRPIKMAIARPTHAKVRDVADQLTRQEGRQVTFSEAIDIMYACWLADREEAGR